MIRAAALVAVTWTAASVVTCAAFSVLKRAGERHNTRAAANALGVEEFSFGEDMLPADLWAEAIREKCMTALEAMAEAEGDWPAWEAEVDA